MLVLQKGLILPVPMYGGSYFFIQPSKNKFQFVELRKSKLTQFLNSTQTAVSVVPLLVLCWYHRTIK